uniref:VWFA domain-containing protein n=1 Tax=Chromera velia CCMP2878 TaxID=1169474 RepID=A0A0G4FMG4_9ALVE|eukprot:Cvel_17717.t1-p1 / transcript=Cvel_17717.t1 / gene=Cvel_17717 / organism=Chromera_velia_CCMP2878 / gene_product=hypothetical protein / transcript_product=hypothetical protein / location=Cvel_scaffold1430:36213-36683(+) / protein_length=157 / sequence_SO=supercontig / SO=protein_coding / is_pseudo=false
MGAEISAPDPQPGPQVFVQRDQMKVTRRRVFVNLAMDMSGSIDEGQRLPVIKSGARRVLRALKDRDCISIKTFSGDIQDVSGGQVVLEPLSRVVLDAALQSLSVRWTGTALYDTLCLQINEVLALAAKMKVLGGALNHDFGSARGFFSLTVRTTGHP